ncbi:unnamed protein product, partial [Symbiodinium necroappetens]
APPNPAAMTSGSMAGPGGAAAGGSDPMSRLLEGLEKVIKGGKPEELSKTVDSPKLPEISESSSVDFGDWLYLIEHVMSDLSTSSAEWWAAVVQDAQDFYERYQAADQFSRLSMKPAASPTLSEARWSRLDRRGATILLGAAPEDVKKELVATRTRTTLEVLARLMVLYRPGSALEKGQLLRRIESPDAATTVQEAIEGLRQWLRHYQRARDLKLSVPDPSVTLRGIDQLVKKPVQDNPEVAFRMNLLRYHLKVDFSPTEESILAVHRALLAEFEQMGFKKKTRQVQEGTSTAGVRAMDTQQAQVPADPDGRQRALRSTHEPWGLREGLNPDESSKVLNENVMLCKMVCAEAAHGDWDEGGQYCVGFCMEYPEDPYNYMPEGEHRSSCVSVWRTEFMKEFIKETNLIKHQFEQGALGHMFRRPTCCLSNLGLGIQGLKDQRAYVAADNKDADHSVWPHGFRITLADAIHEWKNGESPIVVKKAMTKKELEEWKAHVERGHWPYRRDCSVCLTASGTGRPARRVVHRDAYVMSLDIAGPFADKGKDEVRGKKYRFVLAATYLYPKMRDVPEDAPIPNEEEAEEFLREEEEEPEAHELPEDPECEAQEEEWKKKVADLRKPIELQMLRFRIPLERHTGKEILECIQVLYVQLRAMGLPLTRLHSDRAREFRVKPVRKWCRERDIYQTFTEGLAPTQNAVAESHVKWLKGRARVRLNEMELDKEFWPCAMKHACSQHNARQMGTKTAGIKFGSVVWVKSKKDRGPFDPRWKRGRYMGPADDVREGHVVRLDDGLWLRTLHMRTVRDDEMEMEEEEHIVDLIEPTRRMRGKTKLSDPELRAIRKQERAVLVKELLESKIWDSPQAKVERPQMKEGEELKQGDEFKGNYCSMWVNEREVPGQKMSVESPAKVRPDRLHAPLRGDDGDRIVVIGYTVSKWEKLHQFQCDDLEELGFVLPEREPVVKMMNADGRRRPPTPPIPEENSGAVGPPNGTTAAPPTGATNTVMTSGASFLGPGSSSESTLPRPVSEDHMDVSSGTPAPHTLQSSSSGSRSGQREHLPEMGGERLDSMVVPGGCVELRLKWAIKYIPDLSSQGEEVVMTSAPLLPLAHDEEERMRSRVTWLSEFVEEERKIKARQAERGEYATQRERQLFYKLDDAIDYMNEIFCLSHQAREQATMNMMKLMQEAETTPEVEEMLKALTEPIDTVHGVELQEVKRHLMEWQESIQKEIEVLETSGTLRRVPLQEAKRLAEAGEIVLVEVYTAAANAESVRVALSGAVTDVNSAFTLAPMDEAEIKYGITVPKVVVEAGVVPPNTAYLVDRVFYGLREAPRLWGSFRDKRVHRARLMVEGQECMFLQMETDPAVWRLVPCNNHNDTLALMVIYVDDVMMLAPENVIKAIYQWLTMGVEGDQGWKCSPMDWIGKAPVRYLGMDIRRKNTTLTSFHVSQGSYVGELLKSYPMEAGRIWPRRLRGD